MSISEYITDFHGLPIENYNQKSGIKNSAAAIRISLDDAESPVNLVTYLEELLGDPNARLIRALVVGLWQAPWDRSNQEIIDTLIRMNSPEPFTMSDDESFSVLGSLKSFFNKPILKSDRPPLILKNVKALFFGEMTYTDCEISWINQGNYSALWEVFPDLESFYVRGTQGLDLGLITHEKLKTLVIQSGGFGSETDIETFTLSRLPNLENLEIWLGSSEYGGCSEVSRYTPLMQASLFPTLKRLGIKNSEIQSDIASALMKSSILPQLEYIDFSMGTMGDEDIEIFTSNISKLKGKELDLSQNHFSEEAIESLKAAGLTVISNGQKSGNNPDYRYVSVAE